MNTQTIRVHAQLADGYDSIAVDANGGAGSPEQIRAILQKVADRLIAAAEPGKENPQ